jgi:2-polyprenyl-3-methyl-5-hydroxy-6-metoxy-1,4-benzoquinol methylase
MSDKKLIEEINSFYSIWNGGFKTGYNKTRNQIGIEEYLKKNMTGKYCLEIGCGGGQWSKFIYNLNIFDKIYCIDVLSAEHNNFWEYVGSDKKDKLEYIQIKNFELACISFNCLDYVFSYDVFCHISYSGQEKYLKNLYNKCKTNCTLFIMYADPTKYFKSEPNNIKRQESEQRKKGAKFSNNEELIKILIDDCDSEPMPGRWYWISIKNFINLCSKYNYKILDNDLNIDKSNPITLFTK